MLQWNAQINQYRRLYRHYVSLASSPAVKMQAALLIFTLMTFSNSFLNQHILDNWMPAAHTITPNCTQNYSVTWCCEVTVWEHEVKEIIKQVAALGSFLTFNTKKEMWETSSWKKQLLKPTATSHDAIMPAVLLDCSVFECYHSDQQNIYQKQCGPLLRHGY